MPPLPCAWISPRPLGESSSPAHFMGPLVQIQTDSVGNRIALLLLKLAWRGYPLFHSREHGWIYRVPSSVSETYKHGSFLTFSNPADSTLADLVLHHGFAFHKLLQKNGEKPNVRSSLGKTFVKHAVDGCADESGWRGERGARVERGAQLLDELKRSEPDGRWEGGGWELGFEDKDDKPRGIILPQVNAIGTVTPARPKRLASL